MNLLHEREDGSLLWRCPWPRRIINNSNQEVIVHNEKAMRISAGTLGYMKGPTGAAGTRCLVLSFLICGSYLNDQSHPKNGKECDSPVLILLSVKYYFLYYSKCLIFLEFQLSALTNATPSPNTTHKTVIVFPFLNFNWNEHLASWDEWTYSLPCRDYF